MSINFEQLVKKYHAFYEVSPYYTLVEERHGSPTENKHSIQSGFDVDVHGVSSKGDVNLPPADEYALGYARLKKEISAVSRYGDDCVIEIIGFPSTAFTETSRPLQSEGIIRIRISHRGGDQALGVAEQHALAEVEKRLNGLGIPRR